MLLTKKVCPNPLYWIDYVGLLVTDTFSAVAELCAIVSVPVTVLPEATAATSTSNPLFSTIGIPSASSLPPVSTAIATNDSITSDVPGSTGHASTSTGSTISSVMATVSSTTPAGSTSQSAIGTPASTATSPSQSSNDSSQFESLSILALVMYAGVASLLNMASF